MPEVETRYESKSVATGYCYTYETYGDKFYDFSLFTTLGECAMEGRGINAQIYWGSPAICLRAAANCFMTDEIVGNCLLIVPK